MTVTDQIKILDEKIKLNQAQHDLGREAAKISALSSKDFLDTQFQYLTGEDLQHKATVFKKPKFEYSPLVMSLNKACKKDGFKSVAKSKSDFNYDGNHTFFESYKRIDKFKDMSVGSKYTVMKQFNKRLIKFKNVKPAKSKKGANCKKC